MSDDFTPSPLGVPQADVRWIFKGLLKTIGKLKNVMETLILMIVRAENQLTARLLSAGHWDKHVFESEKSQGATKSKRHSY